MQPESLMLSPDAATTFSAALGLMDKLLTVAHALLRPSLVRKVLPCRYVVPSLPIPPL